MSRFTTLVCDRCGAHFPLEEQGSTLNRPVNKVEIEWYRRGTFKSEAEVCNPCLDLLLELWRNWRTLSGK